MKYKGIVITGTSCAGKTTIASRICKKDTTFEIAHAYTTREKREDDNGQYTYVNKKQFLKMKENKDFVTTTKYRNSQYGITREAVEKIIYRNVVPILIVAPDSFQQMEEIDKYLVVFIDADDAELEERYKARNHMSLTSDALAQVEADRKYADYAHYLLKNHKIEKTIELLEMLWQSAGSGGVLPQKMISLMLECDMLLKNAAIEKIQGASYDLTLGDEYYYGGRIKHLTDENLILKIEPYDYAIVSCKEYVTLPKDITANFGLTVGLFCQGIILSNGQQVDPGFRGTLFCLLFTVIVKVVVSKILIFIGYIYIWAAGLYSGLRAAVNDKTSCCTIIDSCSQPRVYSSQAR